jgi:hypothetical protein
MGANYAHRRPAGGVDTRENHRSMALAARMNVNCRGCEAKFLFGQWRHCSLSSDGSRHARSPITPESHRSCEVTPPLAAGLGQNGSHCFAHGLSKPPFSKVLQCKRRPGCATGVWETRRLSRNSSARSICFTRRANQQNPVKPLLEKYSDLQNIQISCTYTPSRSLEGGGSRSSRTRNGMRWTWIRP